MKVNSDKECEVMIESICEYIRSCKSYDHFTGERHTAELARSSATKLLKAANIKSFNVEYKS